MDALSYGQGERVFQSDYISFANMEKNQSRYCQLVVGALVGQDNARNLRVFDELFKKIENIRHIRFNGTSTAVQLFIIGDNKGLSALKGHAGQASRNPCLLCPILNISLRKWETLSLVALPLRSYALDEPGIKEEPLIQTSAPYIVPPTLHSIIAPVQILYEKLIEDVNYLEMCILKKKEPKKEDLPSNSVKSAKVTKVESSKLNTTGFDKAIEHGKRFLSKINSKSELITVRNSMRILDNNVIINADMSETNCQRSYCYGRIGVKLPHAISGSTDRILE